MTARGATPILGILLLILTGCAGGPMTSSSDAASRPPFRTAAPSTPSAHTTTVPPARWAAIEGDLRERGVEGAPALLRAEAITWPNGALGCPRPGAVYTQALVAGMRVLVEVGGREYDYRFGDADIPVLCERGTPLPRRS
jgi:hypothetical protein